MMDDPAYSRALDAWCSAVATVAVGLAVVFAVDGEHAAVGPLLLLAALCVFAEHIIVRLPNGSSVSASVMISLAAVFVFRDSAPLLGPLLVGMAGGIYWPHLRARDWRRVAFNVARGLASPRRRARSRSSPSRHTASSRSCSARSPPPWPTGWSTWPCSA